jgi:hypothetical protein
MSSPLINFANRVLSVDQESTSFVPIVGLNKAADMPLLDSMMHAWRGCSTLRDSIEEGDMEVTFLVAAPVRAMIFLTRGSGHRLRSAAALQELVCP